MIKKMEPFMSKICLIFPTLQTVKDIHENVYVIDFSELTQIAHFQCWQPVESAIAVAVVAK